MEPGGTPRLVAGLGNPGQHYANTRHNIGFLVLDELARREGEPFRACPRWNVDLVRCPPGFLVKPMTFMNLSGQAVAPIAKYFGIEPAGVLAVVDDVALALGRIRLRKSGSAGGHNGLKSLAEHLGTTDFPRLRIGIGAPGSAMTGHVLGRFQSEELLILDEVLGRAADAVQTAMRSGLDMAMNLYNQKPQKEKPNE